MKFYKLLVIGLMAVMTVACGGGSKDIIKPQPDPDTGSGIQTKPGMNLVGKVTVSGSPRQGIVVSDGVNVVITDANGEYQMSTTGRQHVFVSIPADCEVPVSGGMPKIYQVIDFSKGKVATCNFDLQGKTKLNEWTLFIQADPQLGNTRDIADYTMEILPGMKSFAASISPNAYGIQLGDIVWNKPENYAEYTKLMSQISVPFFSVIGNHDHNENVKNDTDSDKEFRDALGPTYYSLNIGDAHIVVLDDVLYSGATGRNDYKGTITDQQLEWLKKDLSFVSRDKMIILGIHIPSKRRNSTSHVSNNQALYDLIKGYAEVQILSGHSHNQYTTTIADNMTETTFGAVMGAYWYPLCNDGSPRGYAAMKIKGNKAVDKFYMGTDNNRDYQMKLYKPEDAVLWDPSKNPGTPYDKILANIFCWHQDWTVEVQEDGGSWKTLTDADRLIPANVGGKVWDPDVRKCLNSAGEIPANHSGSKPENKNDHMFLYTPAESWSSVTFRATDSFGNQYTSTLNK